MKHLIRKFYKTDEGAVTVETSLIILLLIILTGGTIEAGYAFHQYNGAQQAARTGARIAATSDPVAGVLATNTQVSSLSFAHSCSQATQTCSSGQYDAAAMNRIIFGPDGDGACAATSRPRRGMCDVFMDTKNAKVEVSYVGSGLGRTGALGEAAPLVSVTLSDVPLNFIFLDLVGFKNLVHLPPVEATLMGEDLKNG